MKKTTRIFSVVLGLVLCLCLALGFAVFNRIEGRTASAAVAGNPDGITFAGPQQLKYSDDNGIDKYPQTFEAVFKLPAEYATSATRGGVIFGAYNQAKNNVIQLEIREKAMPSLGFFDDASGTIWSSFHFDGKAERKSGDIVWATKEYQIAESPFIDANGQVCVATGDWVHMVVVHNTTDRTLSLYLNGDLIVKYKNIRANVDHPTNAAFSNLTGYKPNGVYYIGSDFTSDKYFRGNMKSFAMYANARTEAQIDANNEKKSALDHADSSMFTGYDFTREIPNAYIDMSGYNKHIEPVQTVHEADMEKITAAGKTALTAPANANGIAFNEYKGLHADGFSSLPVSYEAEFRLDADLATSTNRGGPIIGAFGGRPMEHVHLEVRDKGLISLLFQSYTNNDTYDNYSFQKGMQVTLYEGTNPAEDDVATCEFLINETDNKELYDKYVRVDGNNTNICVATGDWVRATTVYDATARTVTLYLDGTAVARYTNVPVYDMTVAATSHYIGSCYENGENYRFKGDVRKLNVYSDARTAQEVAAGTFDANDAGLMAAYDFTKAYPTLLTDISGNGYDLKHGDGFVGVLNQNAKTGEGMSFDKDHLYVVDKKLASVPATFEVEYWAPAATASAARLGVFMGNWCNNANIPALAYELHNNLRTNIYTLANSATDDAGYTLATARVGRWNHLAYVYDDTTNLVSLYVNGKLEGVQKIVGGINPSVVLEKTFTIGGDGRLNNSQYFKGKIRSIALFSDMRTQSEIVADITEVKANESGLMALYDLNNQTDGIIEDLSGNGYNALKTCAGTYEAVGANCIKHSFSNYIADGNATCTADGTKTSVCSSCVRTETVVDNGSKLDHVFTTYTHDGNATCTSHGTETAECDTCDTNATDTRNATSGMLSHTFTNYVADGNATCTSHGTETAECDTCDTNATDTRNATSGMLDHTFTTYVADGNATCTSHGTETAECDTCDTNATDTREATSGMLEHSYVSVVDEDYLVSGATCVNDAVYKKSCEDCGIAHATETFEAEDTATGVHIFTTYTHDGNATCTGHGTETAECDTCDTGATNTREATVGMVDHSYGEGVITTQPTVEADGEKTYTCTECGATKTEKVDKLPPPAPEKSGCSKESLALALSTLLTLVAAAFIIKK